VANTVGSDSWAILDLNNPTKTAGKPPVSKPGAVKSAVNQAGSAEPDGPDGDFAEALAMIARLPLSDAEKADAVRKLLDNP